MWHSTYRYPSLQQAERHHHHPHASMVWLQVDAASSERLRAVVIRAGGDAVRFLRIDACAGDAHGGTVRALLCVETDACAALRAELLRQLPACAWQVAPRRGEALHAC